MKRNSVLRFIRASSPAALPRILCLVLCVASLAACKPKQAAGEERSGQVEPVPVRTITAAEKKMPVTMKLTGTLRPEREARIAAGSAGRVLKMNVERGAQVKANQVLAELDGSSASLSTAEAQKLAESAKVQRDAARKDCERVEQLYEGGAISKSELELRRSQCRSADLNVETASLRVAMGAQAMRDAAVRAPFAGTIDSRSTDVGEYLMPGSPIVTLVAIDKLRLDVVVPEAHLSKIGLDETIEFQVAAYADRSFRAQVRVLGATVRPGTRDLIVEASVDNADGALKPGMFATATLTTSERNMPVIPKAALKQSGNLTHVFVVVDGRAHERVVKLGPEQGELVGVERGVSVGEKLIVPASEGIKNGAFVSLEAEGG